MWTTFWDMHSGGDLKEPPYSMIFIEAPQDEATAIFYNRFGHNPNRVTCSCCGEDYSIDEHENIVDATGFHRNCYYDKSTCAYIEGQSRKSYSGGKYVTLEEYEAQPDVLFIRDKDIKSIERKGDIPARSVWCG